MNHIPVIVLRNKTNNERYLAANEDVGDWEDENLDVTMSDIQNAYIIVRKDLAVPTQADFEEHKQYHAQLKKMVIEKWGMDTFVTLDFEAVCQYYDPVNIEITEKQYAQAKELME